MIDEFPAADREQGKDECLSAAVRSSPPTAGEGLMIDELRLMNLKFANRHRKKTRVILSAGLAESKNPANRLWHLPIF